MSDTKRVRIIIESSADIKPELLEKVEMLPMTITFGEESFLDRIEITHKQFYEKLVESDTLPTTSQIMPFDFAEAFKKAHKAGESVVVITLSSKLSGTYQSACIAASETDAEVYVVDSLSVAIGSGILAQYAVTLKEEGKSAKEIADALERIKGRVRVIAMVNTLEYLKKGGRISSAVAFAGELMSIKPVVAVDDGEVQMRGKARGSRQANNLLVKEIEASGGVDFSMPVLLGYTGLSDDLLKKYIEDSSALWKESKEELSYVCIGSIVGTHVGPGAVAVAFFSKA